MLHAIGGVRLLLSAPTASLSAGHSRCFSLSLSCGLTAQLALLLSLLNTAYKVLVVWTGVSLQMAFSKREALIERMELDAGVTVKVTSSSGEPLDARSLAAQVAR